MSNHANRPLKTRQMIERYHTHRRRQLLLAVGVLVLLLAFLGLCFLVYAMLATYNRSVNADGSGRPSARRNKLQLARIGETRSFKPAPWFIALDDAQVYTATDNTLAATEPPSLPVDTLEAFTAKGREPLWKNEQQQELLLFGAAGGNILCLRRIPTSPLGFELEAINGATGEKVWNVLEPLAENCQAAIDGKVVVVSFRQGGNYRIVGFNAATGAKAWVYSLSVAGGLELDLSTQDNNIDVSASQGVVQYRLANRCGLLDDGTGKRMREVKAKGYIYAIEYDRSAQLLYVINGSSGSYLLQCVPMKGSAVDMYRFTAGEGTDPLLVVEQNFAALSYAAPGASGTPVQKVMCFAAGGSEPLLAKEFEQGVVWDIAPLPSMPGEFLLALCEGQDQSGRPSGWCELHRLRAPAAASWLLKRLAQPVLVCVPFKEDCLVLVRGGDIYSYRGSGKLHRLKHMAYPNLDIVFSASQSRLAITSYSEKYLQGLPGEELQLAVFN